METANDASNYALKHGRTYGTLRAINEFSSLRRSHLRIDTAMKRVTILAQKYKVTP
jgi:hypothetical protein